MGQSVSPAVGDLVIETTPSGRTRRHTIIGLDVEPTYRHGHDGPFIELMEHGSQTRHILRQSALDDQSWLRLEKGP